MDDLKNRLKDYQETPKSINWDRINGRLSTRRTQWKINQFRNLSVAAVFIALLAFGFTINHYVKNHNPAKFTTGEAPKTIKMEQLDVVEEEFYSVQYIARLKDDYSNYEDNGRLF